MQYSKQLHNSLEQAFNQHKALNEKFVEFASFIKGCVQTPAIENRYMTVSLQGLDHGHFSVTYANRNVTFVFNSLLKGGDGLAGNVKCYVQKQFPENKQIELGEFDFDEEGHTNLVLPNEDAKINIANDFGTLHIALPFIRLSLTK